MVKLLAFYLPLQARKSVRLFDVYTTVLGPSAVALNCIAFGCTFVYDGSFYQKSLYTVSTESNHLTTEARTPLGNNTVDKVMIRYHRKDSYSQYLQTSYAMRTWSCL